MNSLDYWKRFEQTGYISDYLNYTACTLEEATGYKNMDIKEGGKESDNHTYDRDGVISHAHWRI